MHVHRFPLHTEYASVIGYIKSIQDRWKTIEAVYADVTGVGNYIVEDMISSGINDVTGISFTVKSKEEMADHYAGKNAKRRNQDSLHAHQKVGKH